jgi:hypothetical protein
MDPLRLIHATSPQIAPSPRLRGEIYVDFATDLHPGTEDGFLGSPLFRAETAYGP